MKKIKFLIFVTIGIVVLSACKPRVGIDMTQWGDQAIIDNVQVFKYEVDDDPTLYETMNNVGNISGVRKLIISGEADIDLENATVTVPLLGEESLDDAGLIFYHQSKKIEPVGDTPSGGHIGDLTGELQYRLISADGTERVWTVNIES